MVELNKINEDLSWISDRLSTGVRVLAAAAIALVVGILVQDAKTYHVLLEGFTWLPWVVGIVAVVVICLDALQYVSAYFDTDALRRKMERNGQENALYPFSFWRIIRFSSFYAKLVGALALAALLVLLLMIIMATRAPEQVRTNSKSTTEPTTLSASAPASPVRTKDNSVP